MTWSVPRMWEGETIAVLASGPSMSREIADQVRAAGLKAIAINTTFRLAPWADLLHASDHRWWDKYHKETEAIEFAGLKTACERTSFKDVNVLTSTGSTGFDDDPSHVRSGGNSGYAAIHIAAHAGAKRILLLGYDMHGDHWHGRHPEPLRNAGDGIFNRWLTWYDTLSPELTKRGIEVVNCTSGSHLKVWPIQPLEQAIGVHA